MKVVDLCCGAGGFSEGFRQAGFEIILGVDIWDVALATFKMNQNATALETDIRTRPTLPECDVIIGSPPCQCFSRANKNKNKNKTIDTSIIESFLETVETYEPTYWVMEEVPGILKHFPNLKPLAYKIPAYRYGVQQIRNRVYIGNIPPPPFKAILEKRLYPAVTATEYKGKSGRNYGRLADGIGRKPTIEECRDIMGFPKEYFFSGSKTDQYIQIGNAVCPPMAKAIAEGILKEEDVK